jgi:L-alanine-DL-glutamate epimerase-like enolase superfamily enzyme
VKISHVTTRIVKTPGDSPLVFDQPPATSTFDFVTLELGTDQGLVGVGVTFFGDALLGALKVAVHDLATLLIGDDPTQTEQVAGKLRAAGGNAGPGGVFTLALSAIDMACWDLTA